MSAWCLDLYCPDCALFGSCPRTASLLPQIPQYAPCSWSPRVAWDHGPANVGAFPTSLSHVDLKTPAIFYLPNLKLCLYIHFLFFYFSFSSSYYINLASSNPSHRRLVHSSSTMPANPPPGTYPPGTKITVGAHKVSIKSYISEGGFAHVYTVYVNPPLPNGETIACLKRVRVPDKIQLNLLRAEVAAMVCIC